MGKKQGPFIQSLQRATDILNCFTAKEPSLSLAQISQKTGLNINTTRGLVNTLVHEDLIAHNTQTNTYSLGLFFVAKAHLVHQSWSMNYTENYLEDIALSYMKELTEKYALFSGLQIVKEDKIFMIKAIQPNQSHYRITPELYTPLEAYCTASGKLYLQYLSESRQKEELENIIFKQYTPNTFSNKEKLLEALGQQKKTLYATEFDERDIGIGSFAAPILRTDRQLFGTISVIAPSQVLKSQQKEICADLIKAGKQISRQLNLLIDERIYFNGKE